MTLAKRYDLTGQLARIVTAAERDPDSVAMLTLGGDVAGPDNEAAIVVIKGHREIELFRVWARRNELLTFNDTGMAKALEDLS